MQKCFEADILFPQLSCILIVSFGTWITKSMHKMTKSATIIILLAKYLYSNIHIQKPWLC